MSNQNRQEYFETDSNDLLGPGVLIYDGPKNIDITFDSKLHPMIISNKRAGTVDKMCTKQDVEIKIPQKGEIRNPDTAKIIENQSINDIKKEILELVDRRINDFVENVRVYLKMEPARMYGSNSNQNPQRSVDFVTGNGDQRKRPHTNADKMNISRGFRLAVSSKAQNKNSDVSSVQTEFQNCTLNEIKQDIIGIGDSNGLECTSSADSKILQSENGGTNVESKVQFAESMVTQMITIPRQDKKFQKSELMEDTACKSIYNEISSETGVKIEMFPGKDNSTLLLNGNKEDVVVTKLRIAANFQMQENYYEIVLNVPPKYHSHFLNRQAEVKNQISAENNNVSIVFPPLNSSFSGVFIYGPKYFVGQAKNKINAIVNELEKRNTNNAYRVSDIMFQQTDVCANSIHKEPITFNMSIEPELHTMIIGKKGKTADKIRAKYDVKIIMPKRGETNKADTVTIIGYGQNVENAKNEILKMVEQRKNCYKRTIFIETQVRSRIIGYQGCNIKKIMDDYHVYIKTDRINPNLFIIYPEYGFTRHNVEKCIHYLHTLQEKYINELIEFNQKPLDSAKCVMGNGDRRERTRVNKNSTRRSPSFVGTRNKKQYNVFLS